jgi:hypothetical protein
MHRARPKRRGCVQLSLISLAPTVKPGRLEILDIDNTFCAAHGGQQLAFWNAHHDERGFASMHIYHVASGTPVVAILRPARTPKGTEVRTVVKHVTKRLRQHWPNTRIVWRGAPSWSAANPAISSRAPVRLPYCTDAIEKRLNFGRMKRRLEKFGWRPMLSLVTFDGPIRTERYVSEEPRRTIFELKHG